MISCFSLSLSHSLFFSLSHTHTPHQSVSCVFVFATTACVSLPLLQVTAYLCHRGSGWMNHTNVPATSAYGLIQVSMCLCPGCNCLCAVVPATNACVSLSLPQVSLSLLQVPVCLCDRGSGWMTHTQSPCYKCLCVFVTGVLAG